MRLIKLVRDRIDAYASHHTRITYAKLTRQEHIMGLRRKLGEETTEYLLDPCASELADLLEVVHSLAVLDLGISVMELEDTQQKKRDERGAFQWGLGMFASE